MVVLCPIYCLPSRFSIWNTMMGTSLLSMPWALQQAGFAMGLVLMLIMAGLALYTCYRVVESVQRIGEAEIHSKAHGRAANIGNKLRVRLP